MLPADLLLRVLAPLILLALAAGGCGHLPGGASSREHECMTRVMYFESNRSSAEGMLAVGTVVMNRVESGKYPKTVCGVVGQKNQFAPGVLTKPMKEGKPKALAEKVAWDVLHGKRHRGVGDAMFFHTAGYKFPYRNMHYKVVAGGNSFYEKRNPTPGRPNRSQGEVMLAAREAGPERYRPNVAAPETRAEEPDAPPPIVIAAAEPVEPARLPVAAPEPPPLIAAEPPPVLAIAPMVIAPTSIEDLIALDGG